MNTAPTDCVKMKNFLTTIGLCFVAACLATSCLKEEETVSSPECAITAFTVGDIKTAMTIQTADGSDSTVTRVLSGSSIHFNIDQLNGTIYSVDSLPRWVNQARQHFADARELPFHRPQ